MRRLICAFVVRIWHKQVFSWRGSYNNIYIFIAIALNKTSILVALHFSMQNIYQSCGLVHAMGWSNVNVSQ